MRYMVIVLESVTVGDVFSHEELEQEGVEADPDTLHHQKVSRVVPCEDSRSVAKALNEVRLTEDWSVWENTPDGTCRQRAIVRKLDGKACYDVEIS